MGLVLARHPALTPPGGVGELAFELGALGAVTLRQLQHFVAACARPGGALAIWPGLSVGAGAPRQKRLTQSSSTSRPDAFFCRVPLEVGAAGHCHAAPATALCGRMRAFGWRAAVWPGLTGGNWCATITLLCCLRYPYSTKQKATKSPVSQ